RGGARMTELTAGSLLALFVAVPLLGAGLSVILRRRVVDRVLLVGVPALAVAGSVALMLFHRETPVVATAIGSFEGGIAIPLVSDMLAALMLATTGLATAA